MAMRFKTRRRLALLILVVGLPLYIVVAVNVIDLLGNPPFWAELLIYVALGLVWAFPLKSIFRGVAQADPDAPKGRG